MSAEDLALASRERRIDLGLRQGDLEARGGPSSGTVRNIEQAAKPSYAATTLRSLDRCLGWVAGSSAKALEAGELPVVAASDPRKAEDARAMRIGYAVLALLRELES